MMCSASGPRIARKSASWWFRKVATNAFTASSADGKLRCDSGVLGGAACAMLNQRMAIVAHGQRFASSSVIPLRPRIFELRTCPVLRPRHQGLRYTAAPRRGKPLNQRVLVKKMR